MPDLLPDLERWVLTALARFFGAVALLVAATVGWRLAVRDTVSNMIAGLIILWDRPFAPDDIISIDGVEGRVERIGLRSSHLRSADGARVIIPNSLISTTRITNRPAPGTIRLRMPLTMTVDRDTPELRQVLLDALRADSAVLRDPTPQLQIMEVNDWTVRVELWAWVRTTDAEAVRLKLHDQVLTALRQTPRGGAHPVLVGSPAAPLSDR